MNIERARKVLENKIVVAPNPEYLTDVPGAPYFHWEIGTERATLDGDFSAEELRAIAAVMENGGFG
jgi:hypothetical protein